MRSELRGIGISIVGLVLAVALSVLYTNDVDRNSERRNQQRAREICGLTAIMDNRYQKLTSPDPDQKQLVDELRRFRTALGC
jgi:hypothetical protein